MKTYTPIFLIFFIVNHDVDHSVVMSCDVTWRLKWFCGYLDAADTRSGPTRPGPTSLPALSHTQILLAVGFKAAVSGGQTCRTVKQTHPASLEQATHVNTFILKPLVLQHVLKITKSNFILFKRVCLQLLQSFTAHVNKVV